MTYTHLSALVSELRTVWLTKVKQSALPLLQQNAALLQMVTYGPKVPPPMVNVCGLAIASESQLCVHALKPAAISLVQQTDVRSFADRHPSFLNGPFLIETTDTKSPLFRDVMSVGGYKVDGIWFLVIMCYPDGVIVCQWDPQWQEGEVGLGLYHMISQDMQAKAESTLIDAVQFIVTFGMLLDAENTPVTIRTEPRVPKSRDGRKKEKLTDAKWSVNYVSLSQDAIRAQGERDSVGTHTNDGLVLSDVRVSGHLRNQRHGPGRSQIKVIYVREFSARRWVAPQKRVIVTD